MQYCFVGSATVKKKNSFFTMVTNLEEVFIQKVKNYNVLKPFVNKEKLKVKNLI